MSVSASRIGSVVLGAGLLIALAGCEYISFSDFAANDLAHADYEEPTLLAGYLFDGNVVDIAGATEPEFYATSFVSYDPNDPDPPVPEDDVRFVTDRDGGGAFHFPGGGFGIELPAAGLPRSWAFWIRIPGNEGGAEVTYASGFDPEGFRDRLPEESTQGRDILEVSTSLETHDRSVLITTHRTTVQMNRDTAYGRFAGAGGRISVQQNTEQDPDWSYRDWHHVAVVLDRSGRLTLYLDGAATEHSTRSYSDDWFSSVTHLVVYIREAYDVWDDDAQVNDDQLPAIDDLFLFDSVLSPDQIQQLYEGTLEVSLE